MKRKSVHCSLLLVLFQYDLGAGNILNTSLVTINMVSASSSTDFTVGPISKGHPSNFKMEAQITFPAQATKRRNEYTYHTN